MASDGNTGSVKEQPHNKVPSQQLHQQPQGPPLNVIALISGGKDSLFSILHCLANGHNVVALANLHPPKHQSPNGTLSEDEEGDDLNSYMYQTVGHTVIPLYSQALNLPLYRQEILGTAVNTSRDYSAHSLTASQSSSPTSTSSDETESLIPLLRKVMAAHPSANAISTGAILSTYQRTRVESVALRLGLVPLSYLWQYPLLPPYSQCGLLRDMVTVGQDSRIIKVASGGLDASFVWEDVAAERTIKRMQRAMARFGENGDGAILGEGGEFETLAVDGPGVLWKGRIEIEEDGVVTGEGGNVVFRGKNQRVVQKEENDERRGLEDLRMPDVWDDEFKSVLDALTLSINDTPTVTISPRPSPSCTITLPINTIYTTPSTLTLSNFSNPPSTSPAAPSTQLLKILETVTTMLFNHNLTPSSISHTTLILRHISLFAPLNELYASIFPSPNPPSRVTVACGDSLPPGIDVMLSAIVPYHHAEERRGLHVQSRSYWAPANIGPYSQAICSPLPSRPWEARGAEVVYVAGQIPLVPSTMEPPPPSPTRGHFAKETTLALQHLWRIGRAMEVRWWAAGVAYISSPQSSTTCLSDEEVSARVRVAQNAWRSIHEMYLRNRTSTSDSDSNDEDEDVDPWDARNKPGAGVSMDDTTFRAPIPDPDAVVRRGCREEEVEIPPCFVVQVAELPRSVSVEWHSTGIARGKVEPFPDGSVAVVGTGTTFFAVEVGIDGDGGGWEEMAHRVKGLEHGTLYVADGADSADFGPEERFGELQWVPCQRVWGRDGREVSAVVVGRVSVDDRGSID
ncbi:adenine nucleotide alpha hydrolases-like protein [Aaosphaeria arxii CBS 175.79]|uniref:Diphthine--ammonia ligase n=1 Tax=Aaosphaeria arxii CBS 175.79 TaxID=1450172 RepID=A0A6A5XSM3_9PLEO|nr:adenine nucleotide alpha hydrolases-like protein [Aaosphaeria arxii CBS 175.79]KAF2015899.1 adenine nucleotide alpha hydrolases-like protein [Aaosphaeria arxii CBS 175.79]